MTRSARAPKRPSVSYGYCDGCGELSRIERVGGRLQVRCERCSPVAARATIEAPRTARGRADGRSRRTIALALGLPLCGLAIFLVVVARGRSVGPTRPAAAPAAAAAAAPANDDPAPEAPPPVSETWWCVNTRTGVLHRNACEFGATISPSNRRIVSSPEEALAKGYRWCRSCGPRAEGEVGSIRVDSPGVDEDARSGSHRR